jgi:hypothetical protein
MADEVKDVNTAESSNADEVVNQEAETETAVQEQPTEETNEQSKTPSPSEGISGDVDEFGVPWKNRAMEWQRKFQENTENLPRMIEEALAKNQAQPQKQQHTIAELEAYALQNPQYRPWVEEEKAKIIQNQVAKVTEEKVREIDNRNKMMLKDNSLCVMLPIVTQSFSLRTT